MKTILLATDFSPAGNNAVKYGCAMAKKLSANVVVVHAYSLPLGGYDSMAPLEVISEMQTASRDALRDFKKELIVEFGSGFDIDIYAGAGSSEGIISEAAQKYSAALVVVGIVAQAGAFKKHLTGSTVTDVIHDLTIPVLIVPEASRFREISSVVFAFDPHEEKDSTPAMMVKQFANLFSAKLELLSVLPMPIDDKLAEKVKIKAQVLFADALHKTTIIHAPDVKKGLEGALNISTADLVLIHPKRHGFLSRLFESGTAARLVYALKTPMLSFHV